MMAKFNVTYYDIEAGCVDAITVEASCSDAAGDAVEMMGEYEVIEVTREGGLG